MTLELRGSARPTLQQALRWIGSRVDDIYGASIGKLEDIWMDPDSGEPLWLLVRDGRIGGRHTLVPFAQAASGAGHVWIPFEREVVRGAPAVRPSAPLSHELSDTLRRYYAESGHPVAEGARTDDAVRVAEPEEAATAAPEAEPREYTHAFAQTAATPSSAAVPPAPRRPAPPPREAAPRRESRPRQAWTPPPAPAAHAAPPQPPPLPPMPPRQPPPAQTQTRPPRQQAPADESFTAPRPQAPRAEQPRFEPPPRPDQAQRATPPPAAAPSAPEELHLAVGEGVDMELVGRLQFRGNIVRVQPLQQGSDS